MRVLVTGASGLLGANVVEWMLSQGYEVNALLRRTSDTRGLTGLSPIIHFGDLEDKNSIFKAAKGCQAIIHCAANTKQWGSSREEHDRINLHGTMNIIAAAGKARVEKVVMVSTANTFPILNDPTLSLDTEYVQSKLAAEKYVLEQQVVKCVVVNPSFMIGPRDSKPSSGQSILHYLRNKIVFTPSGGKSFIHVRDVAEAIQKVLELPVYGKRYLLANDNKSYQSFFKIIAKVTNRNHLIIPIPSPAIQLGGALGSFYKAVTGKSPQLNSTNASIINHCLYYDGSASYHELKISPRKIDEAVQEAVDWFESHRYF
ncbi:NAD-dependent epimerase/dehydratase family protein [Anditalea andensis]|uniref:NAD-dependent epimerase/dehydratase domain-containing protein n=1 Tax=Anditalea andensis TaxID=1048983 RepID=A0A074KZC8_9BACT|nr:NAD-dependent epimerase/dehydratase family protein [Anditalea andensis]KEO75341.1 hypothetical protein EL17_02030 [Anditalea andensis]